VFLDGIVLKRSWAGEVRNVSLLVAIGVNSQGFREILGICEGAKEDWSAFLKDVKGRGLEGGSTDPPLWQGSPGRTAG
jgi:putative transposase